MSFIGEAVLSASVELLIEKLASKGLELFTRHEELEADLIKWKGMLEMIQAVLADAEDRQTKDKAVKKWLDNLENLAYDLEDVLDEFQTESLRRELLPQEPAAVDQSSASTSSFWNSLKRKVTGAVPLGKFPKLSPSDSRRSSFNFESMMASKIKGITDRLQDIERGKGLLDLKNVISDGKSKINVGQRLPTTSLVNEAKVYGREKDKEAIVELLLRDDLRADDGFSVISIKGLGGVGKTTLAQLVYNDDRVQRHFEIEGWTCVSDGFDVFGVSKSILKSIAKDQSNNDDDLNSLQVKLKNQLSGKKFLLILDDVWNENYRLWRTLSCPFGAGAPGSKIVVTTRNLDVAATMGAYPVYPLKELSDDDCLCVLTQISLGARDFNGHQSLKEVGEQMVIKCRGLPLAAETLGGLLRGRYDPKYWESVLKTEIWDLPDSDILPVLRVSYHFLPSQLKQCFAYCSLFPKDYEFEEEEIILLWTAEGFLDYNGREMEDLGREFVRELHSRSLFQQSSKDASRFVMHDLISDLARWAAGEQYFRMEDTSADENRQKFSQRPRHFSYICGRYDGDTRLEFIGDVQHLRTFLPVNLSDYGHNSLAWSVLQKLLNRLPRLRVFSLCGYCNIFNLPNEIGNLKHLRCLNLSRTSIQILPESVNSLYNLHTILLEDCWKLKKLCNDMGNLKKLRHLKNSNVFSLEEMPKGFGRLTSLLTSCRFVVGKDSGSGLRELKSLTHLQGTLIISQLENVKNDGDACEAQLNNKENLKALFLEWSARNIDQCEIETRVLSKLEPHRDVQELTFIGYGGTKFPIWLGDSSFSKLVHLTFSYCCTCTSLPSVGQLPLLKHLQIRGMGGVKRVGSEFYGSSRSVPFQSLETLSFRYMQEWEEWEEWIPFRAGQEVDKVFPKLRRLSLCNCGKLRGTLPKRLLLLETLDITSCDQLEVTIQSLPALSELQIRACKRVVFSGPMDLSSLKLVHLYCIANEVVLPGLLEQGLPKLESLEISDVTYLWQSETRLLQQQPESPCRLQFLKLSCGGLTRLPQALLTLSSLTEMQIDGCASLVSFPEVALPSQLRSVVIEECDVLESLPEAWMHNSNSSLESLEIRSCMSLVSFPEVGLPSRLRTIEIQRCNALKSLPEAWMHNSNSSLESLEIRSCNSLVEVALPSRLRTIKIDDCNALKSLPEAWMNNSNSSLESLEIRSCMSLVSFPEIGLPSRLRTVEIEDCNALESLPEAWMHNSNSSLESLTIQRCNSLVSFPEVALPSQLRTVRIQECNALESLPEAWMHNSNSSLESLKIRSCNSLVSFPEVGLPSRLRTVKIDDCNALESLPEAWMHNSNSSLESLTIQRCNSLVSFPEVALPSQLRTVVIEYCNALKSLPEAWMHNSNSSLESLTIRRCNSLVFFPEVALPSRLRTIKIDDCNALESLPELPATLEHLEVSYCSNLALLSRNGNLPESLKYLCVQGWSKLESLVERLDNTSLEEIEISNLKNLKSLPAGLHNLHQLQKITIHGCENLKALPNCMHNLTSLLNLEIRWCPSVVSFPEDGFPTNLHSLDIADLKISKALFEWGLNRFTSLRKLEIWGGCPDLVSTPPFPASLSELCISHMPDLESISSIGENLTSLETLELSYCPKLTDFTEQGLPKSLLQLTIDDCPLIEKRYRKDKEKYWPMICHIPRVEINGRSLRSSLFEGIPIITIV